MKKWEVLYVKLDLFWDSIPSPLKVPIYQAFSALVLLVIDYIDGVVITRGQWVAILSAFVANEAAVIIEYLRKQSENLEKLKVEYSKKKMDR